MVYMDDRLCILESHIIISRTFFSSNNCEGNNPAFLCFLLHPLFQNPTFLEIASEISKTGLSSRRIAYRGKENQHLLGCGVGGEEDAWTSRVFPR